MCRPQLSDNLHRLQPSVLGQRVRHQLQGLSILLDANRWDAANRPGPSGQLLRHLHLWGCPARDQGLALHKRPHDAQGIVDGALRLVQQQLVGSPHEHGDAPSLARPGGEAGEADDAALAADSLLAHQPSVGEFVRSEVVDARHWLDSQDPGDELDVITLYIANHEDLGLGTEVQGQIRGCIAEDRLLDKQHIATCLSNLLHHLSDDGTLLTQQAVHL
mmetsp:Transcript_90114/g.226824  ORF Transcript_90114/g.226824 Transcript_90114/m.226824 type:complete len:218 (-) Transcript_90114:844-1497(-)